MNNLLKQLLIIPLLVILTSEPASARSFRVAQLPNGGTNGCANCHVNAGGGGARNAFGQLVQASFLDGGGNVVWGPDLAMADSDGDGYSNGHELEDPFGMWAVGAPAPGETSLVTQPGDNTSAPTGDGAKFSLHINFSEMTPHLGQLFQIRLDLGHGGEQVTFEQLDEISEADYDFTFMHAMEMGQSYDIEFWSDHNGNGFYDAPPIDHAWRITLDAVSDNQDTTFTHNTEFEDIGNPVSVDDVVISPADFALYANYPNPFNPETIISFSIDQAQ
ncbi:hypothetical protein HQ531_10375, partial [bacterium]|nr:hypothetical protein [bacterium]